MKRSLPKFFALSLIVAMGFSLMAQTAYAVSPNIVISQVYGGGGNSGATYTHDFVELFNRGTTAVSLAGWSIQYTSATGAGNFGATPILITELPDVSLAPGQYLLIQEAQGSGGTTPLPTPDVIDSTPISMGATGGKVALVNVDTSLGCNGGSSPCTPEALATIVDLVGWGTANFYEGIGPAPATDNITAIFRNDGGCIDSDNNAADFSAFPPVPRNTHSPLNYCITFTGFFMPVHNPPAINTAKAGRTIPLKFSLGGDKGLDIFADGFPQSVQIDCDTGTEIVSPEATDNPGGSSLSYDPLSMLYNYPWKTNRGWAGTCRKLILQLIDDTVHTANFNFK
jgi:hypothetical protein